MLTVYIRTGIYRSSKSKRIELSTLRWLTEQKSFEFTKGILDGFYETSLTPSVTVEKIAFTGHSVEVFVASEQDVEVLASELIDMDERCTESRSNVRM